jgi:rare lipoprotein A
LKNALIGLSFAVAAATQVQAQSIGQASFYQNPRFGGLIAAHRSLPFGTRLLVTNLGNGRRTTVVVVDRGPFIRNRIIDVSTRAADVLGFRQAGIARVRLDIVEK